MNLLVVSFVLFLASAAIAKYTQQHKSYFSTHTYYDLVRGDIPNVPECKAERLWLFSRHGTRYPHHHELKAFNDLDDLRHRIIKNSEQHKRGTLSKDDLKLFKKWNLEVKKKDAGKITKSGEKELHHLGERLLQHFPQLLSSYSKDGVKINTSSKKRAKQSAKAMLSGIYGQPPEVTDSMVNDDLLLVRGQCPAWDESTESKEAKRESSSFKSGEVVQEVAKQVSDRLGFKDSLSVDTVETMYKMCGYEQAWHHKHTSPWCIPFSKDHLKVLEYLEDLKKYYKGAYGNPLSGKLGCRIVADLNDSLKQAQRNVSLYFSHDEEMRVLLVGLGIAEDQKRPTAANYAAMDSRQWRTSKLIPFSANILAVSYRCQNESDSKVGIFLNEHLLKLGKCQGQELCPLEQFLQAYSSTVDPSICNMDFCTL